MNKLLNLVPVVLLGVSSLAFADKVIISGEPIVLEKSGDNYMLPTGTTLPAKAHYYFVTVDGVNKVCYASKQSNLAGAEESTVNVMVDGKVGAWNCYTYSDTMFEMAK